MSEIEDIKSRLNIADVIGGYIKLIPAGSNHKALCPFHNEKSPSFMVNEDRQIFHCFGCGKGGDVITFVQEIEGIGFREALQMLADRAGIKLERSRPTRQEEGKSRLRELMVFAVGTYRENLGKKEGAKALTYLRERGVSEAMMERFFLGYALDEWRDLLEKLSRFGFSAEEGERAGLLTRSVKDSGKLYDRFRNRVMFPIYNPSGEPIGFSGRVLPGDMSEMGKYINTPQTQLYDKSQAIYGISVAKIAIKKADLCILLEGNLDVVMSHQAGVEHVVATCGTAVTVEQLRIIKRYTKNIAFAFDADQAGIDAAYKGIGIALGSGMNVNAINIGEAGGGFKDVADIVASAPSVWQELSSRTKPIMDYFFDTTLQRYDMARVEEKRRATEELLEKIALVGNRIDQAHYVEKLSDAVRINTAILYDLLNEKKVSNVGLDRRGERLSPGVPATASFSTAPNKEQKLANRIIALALIYPELIDCLKTKEARDVVEEEMNDEARQILAIITESGARFTDPNSYLELIEDERLRTRVARLVTVAEKQFASYNDDRSGRGFSATEEFNTCLKGLREISRKKQMEGLLAELKEAEAAGDKDRAKEIMKHYSAAARKND